MAYYLGLPDDTLVGQVGMPNVGANIQSLTNIVAAPGSTFRFRLWGWAAHYSNIAIAPGKANFTLDDTATTFGRMSTIGYTGFLLSIPGNPACGTNLPLRVSSTCDVANADIFMLVYYTIEPMT